VPQFTEWSFSSILTPRFVKRHGVAHDCQDSHRRIFSGSQFSYSSTTDSLMRQPVGWGCQLFGVRSHISSGMFAVQLRCEVLQSRRRPVGGRLVSIQSGSAADQESAVTKHIVGWVVVGFWKQA
jgi:hypothetical protein